jgi:hypothetical protein
MEGVEIALKDPISYPRFYRNMRNVFDFSTGRTAPLTEKEHRILNKEYASLLKLEHSEEMRSFTFNASYYARNLSDSHLDDYNKLGASHFIWKYEDWFEAFTKARIESRHSELQRGESEQLTQDALSALYSET